MTREQPRKTPARLVEGDVFETPWNNVKIKRIHQNDNEKVYVIRDVKTGDEKKVNSDFFSHMWQTGKGGVRLVPRCDAD